MATLEQIRSQAAALDRDIQAGTVREDSVSPPGRLALDLYRGRVSPEALSDAGRQALGLEPAAAAPTDKSGELTLSDLILGTQGKRGASERPQWQQNIAEGARTGLVSPLRVAGYVQDALAWPFRQAGKLDVAAGIKTPEQAEHRAELYRDVAEAVAVPWSRLPGLAGVGWRALQSGLLGGAQRAAETQDYTEGAKAGLVSAALQPVAEAALYPFRLVAMSRGAKKADAADKAARAVRESKIDHDKVMADALTALEKQGYRETARQAKTLYQTEKQAAETAHAARVASQEAAHRTAAAAHSERAAVALANDLKRNVPALAEFPSNTKGLVDMAYGQGKRKVAEAFDEALQEVIERGQGQVVQLPAQAAKRLGFKVPEDPLDELGPEVVATLKARGALPEGVGTGLVPVDAAELAKRVTGFWKKAPGVYRAAVDALDEAGIGDPAARAAFKYYSGIVQYIDKTKALVGEVLNTEALLKGGTSLRTVEELRRRGIGDVFRGPTQAARGAPPAPPEIPRPIVPPYVPPPGPPLPRKPVIPPEVPKPDVRTVPIPWYIRHFGPAGIGAALGGGGHYGLGGLLGMLAGFGIPKEVVTRAPISEGAARALRSVPGPMGTLFREPLSTLIESPSARLAREALEQRKLDDRQRDLLRQAEQLRESQRRFQ